MRKNVLETRKDALSDRRIEIFNAASLENTGNPPQNGWIIGNGQDLSGYLLSGRITTLTPFASDYILITAWTYHEVFGEQPALELRFDSTNAVQYTLFENVDFKPYGRTVAFTLKRLPAGVIVEMDALQLARRIT